MNAGKLGWGTRAGSVGMALVALAAIACGKKTDGAAAASSATPAAASASAKPAAAPPVVTVQSVFDEFDGKYDGANATAWKYPDGTLLEVKLARDCAMTCSSFGDGWDDHTVAKTCPKVYMLTLGLKPQTGKQTIQPGLLGVAESSTNSLADATVDVTSLTATTVEGTVTAPDGDSWARGSFKATICNAGK